jgi:beta-lactamase class A
LTFAGEFETFSRMTSQGLFSTLIGIPLFIAMQTAAAQSAAPAATHSPELQRLVDRAVQQTLEKFADRKLATNHLAITLVDLRDPQKPVQASFRGNEQIYPASVIKLFYLAAAHQWMEEGRIQDTDELRRAMRDMIVESYNEPTGYVMDLLTGTTSGPELSPVEMEQWYHKRNAVNRYFAALGYTNINANRKPWCEGPYGREQQSVKMHAPNHRNWLTTDATARLMTEIVTGKAVSPARCEQMMTLLQRDPFSKTASAGGQSRGYTGMAVPPGTKLWSKAGWTSQTRHDAAYVELPNGAKFVLVTFTTDHAQEREIIATIARVVVDGIGN